MLLSSLQFAGIQQTELNNGLERGIRCLEFRTGTGFQFKVLIDRKEGNFFIGRTEFDSPDVDNEVLIDATKHFVRHGDFVRVKVYEASDYDLYAEPVL